jgi:hypothetical protein
MLDAGRPHCNVYALGRERDAPWRIVELDGVRNRAAGRIETDQRAFRFVGDPDTILAHCERFRSSADRHDVRDPRGLGVDLRHGAVRAIRHPHRVGADRHCAGLASDADLGDDAARAWVKGYDGRRRR